MSPDEVTPNHTPIEGLEAITRASNAELSFSFHPNAIGPYGIEGSQWQAVFKLKGVGTIDYGRTVEEAAQRLLDRVLHPELYPEKDSD